MRRYNDVIEVRSTRVTTVPEAPEPVPARSGWRGGPQAPDEVESLTDLPPGTPAASPDAPLLTPQAFIWHGRLYVVRRVLTQWRERRAWWREALDPAPGQATGIDVASCEHRVWRVEASPGRSAGSGVFDLVHDEVEHPGESDWRLVRVAD